MTDADKHAKQSGQLNIPSFLLNPVAPHRELEPNPNEVEPQSVDEPQAAEDVAEAAADDAQPVLEPRDEPTEETQEPETTTVDEEPEEPEPAREEVVTEVAAKPEQEPAKVEDEEVAPTQEDEIDAMMKSVMQAVGASSMPARESITVQAYRERVEERAEPEEAPLDEANVEEDASDEAEATPKLDLSRLAMLPTFDEEDDGQAEDPDDKDAHEADPHIEQDDPAPEPEPEPEPEHEMPVPTLEEDLATLADVERRLFAHRYAAIELASFGASIDPSKATADRSEALAVLAEEDLELLGAQDVGDALDRLDARSDELDALVAAQVRVLARDRRHTAGVPTELMAQFKRLTSESYDVWTRARKNDDWHAFSPYLDRIVRLRRKMALAINPDANPYDTLLDEFEPGMTTAAYDEFFTKVKGFVMPLLNAIVRSSRTMSRACVQGRFDERRQWMLALDICDVMGIDQDAHYLTSTVHPFSDAMTSNYAITAGHVDPDDLMSNVFTMFHELGHSLYEQGVNPAYNRTSLKGGTSSGMHEAQARFFENCVARDRAFTEPLLELMRYHFPGQLGRVTANQLYRAINAVEPSLIRVDADEVTYPLHVLVRYEIEKLLISGEARAAEVPQLWADRYESYLGIRPTNHATGALQDVHWATGDFGYFPAYALGNAYAAQLRAKMIDDGIDLDSSLAKSDFAPIRAWLTDHIWRHGRSKDASELIQDACGEPFDTHYYKEYLTSKYSDLYGLRRN